GDGTLAFMMEQALQGGRRAVERQREPLAHDIDREIDFLHAAEHVGQEVAMLEARAVAAMGRLIVGRAIDIVEDRTGQSAACQPSEIVEVMTLCQAHFSTPLTACSARRSSCL